MLSPLGSTVMVVVVVYVWFGPMLNHTESHHYLQNMDTSVPFKLAGAVG